MGYKKLGGQELRIMSEKTGFVEEDFSYLALQFNPTAAEQILSMFIGNKFAE